MWKTWLQEVKERARRGLVQLARDTGDVFQALGAWGVVFLLAMLVLGALPLAAALTLGGTVDALIGARGIAVVTSDLNAALSRWLLLLVLGFGAYLFSLRFTGKAGEVGSSLREGVTFVSLFGYFFLINQGLLSVIFVFILAIDTLWSQRLRIRLVNLCVAIIIGALVANNLITYTVLRSFTVGEGLAMVTAIVAYVIALKFRIARH